MSGEEVKPDPSASTPRPPDVRLALAVLAMIGIWSTTWLAIRAGLATIPPLTALTARLLLASLTLTAVSSRWTRPGAGPRPPLKVAVAMGLSSFTLGFSLVYLSSAYLPSGVIAVLWATNPMLIALLSWRWLGEEMPVARGLGFALGLLGIAALMVTDVPRLGPMALVCAVLVLSSSLISAITTVFIKRSAGRFDPLLLTRDGLVVGLVTVAALALVWERPFDVVWTTPALASVAYLAWFGTCAGFVLWFWALQRATVSRLGLISYVTPVLAVLLGHLVGGEPMTLALAGGTSLVALGVALAAWST